MNNIIKNNSISIYINKQLADIYSQDQLNLRINNMFTDATKIQTITTEYSFSFTLPLTSNNEKIFDYANVLSKRYKFGKRYDTHVNVDGLLIFDGELVLLGVDKDGYRCNLYQNKINTIDAIFGDTKMTEISDWKIDYNQDATINAYNQGEIKYPKDCFFPLIAYGVFQKMPQTNNIYTSKFLIDDYARIYNENFPPALNLLKTVKKCFETKGYRVEGNIFDDELAKSIYMSENISEKQQLMYNYGGDMGKLRIEFKYKNMLHNNNNVDIATSIRTELDDKKYNVGRSKDGIDTYNYMYNNVYDIFSSDSKFLTIYEKEKVNDLLFRKNRIVAPVDGYYKIKLNYQVSIDQSFKFDRSIYKRNARYGDIVRETIPSSGQTWTFADFFTELQIVKNSEDNTDVKNIIPDYVDMVTNETYNKYSAYPHEAKGRYNLSTSEDPYPYGYIARVGNCLGYDASVNKNFICGAACGGAYYYNSVIKNGRSWRTDCADTNKSRYVGNDYWGVKVEERKKEEAQTRRSNPRRSHTVLVPEIAVPSYGTNTLPNSQMSMSVMNGNLMQGEIDAIVYLKKNDYLQPKLLTRRWDNADEIAREEESQEERPRPSSRYGYGDYQTDQGVLVNATIEFEAFAQDNIGITDKYFDWKNPSRFDTKLNLADFLNKEEKMSDFVNNFIKEFNLSFTKNKNIISLDKQKVNTELKNCVDLSDRVCESDINIEAIEYPSKMYVEYSVADDERGVYISAEKNATSSEMESNDWKKYADYGYDKVTLLDDEYSKEEKIKTNTSYSWYEDFKITMDGQDATYPLNIIAKDEWMIDGINYEESAKKDGMSLKRRYVLPSGTTDTYIILNNNKNRKVYVSLASNDKDNYELSYKDKKNTLLDNYFNVMKNTDSNYIIFECYISTEEYVAIKNGSNIIIDDDVYIVIEVQGYDASGNNKTKIKAMKA